ncbi:hypothetical protein GCM10017691_46010 [Pseudonocardia petroleophila]|uniref:DUF222 domain-containing protein n=1 Tax=Pseudonocardia petroleophila TaxID=37331 RepID=A0A7G7MQX1_9PSEU|nr:DUF222 domain-containing protein [Pseudonocardia petroleophila]QNG55182.1 DUF222 domain-containing protein [Pseudonocardia petroleophila]
MPTKRSAVPSEALLIERIAWLEERKAAIAAEQSDAVLAFATAHAESQTAAGEVDPEALERSIAAQIGLACRVSPTEGRRRVRIARDLHAGHARVRELFAAGRLSEYQTATIVAATTHLSPAERAEVDRELAERRVETLGVRRIHDLTRSLAAQVAPEKFTTRCRAARTGRRVSVRPAADGMADLTAHLPVEEAVACYAALAAAVNDAAVRPEPVTRGRGQILADTLVERLTGQATARDVNIEIQVLVPVEALIDPDSPLPAQIAGHGPVPVELLTTGGGRRTWRRLITRDGVVIGGDSRSRLFTGRLAALIRARDGHRCREPYCGSPIATSTTSTAGRTAAVPSSPMVAVCAHSTTWYEKRGDGKRRSRKGESSRRPQPGVRTSPISEPGREFRPAKFEQRRSSVCRCPPRPRSRPILRSKEVLRADRGARAERRPAPRPRSETSARFPRLPAAGPRQSRAVRPDHTERAGRPDLRHRRSGWRRADLGVVPWEAAVRPRPCPTQPPPRAR